MSKDNSERAFPVVSADHLLDGMSMRQWYAGQALVGIIAGFKAGDSISDVPMSAYNIADAMIKEGEK